MSHFSQPSGPPSLKERSIKGAAVTLASQGVSYGLQVGTTVVLARFLTPQEYGTVAMVTAISAMAKIFVDLGLSAATIQKKNITQEQSSNLFWINFSLGALITLLVAASAPLVAWFYRKPELLHVTQALSLTFVLTSLGAQQMSRLTKDMRFGLLAFINTSALTVNLIVSVVAAWHGAGYWALVFGTLSTAIWTTATVWLSSGWIPSLPKRNTGALHLVRFGSWITGFNIVNYFSRNVDSILIGKTWGAAELGLYSRAYSLLMLPITNLRGPMDKVAFPALSRLQDEPDRYRTYFVKYCSTLAFLSMPLVGMLYVSSESIIRLVLGQKWIGAAELFSILALASFLQPVAGLRGMVLLSHGSGRKYFIWGLWNAVVTVIAFLCGLPWGAKGVAIAYCISIYAQLHPSLVYAFHKTALKPGDFYSAITKPAIASTLGCVTAVMFRNAMPPMNDWMSIGFFSIISLLVYLAAFAVLPAGRNELKESISHLALLLRSRKPSPKQSISQ